MNCNQRVRRHLGRGANINGRCQNKGVVEVGGRLYCKRHAPPPAPAAKERVA